MRGDNDLSELDLLRRVALDAYAFHAGLELDGVEITQESRDALQYLNALIAMVAEAESQRNAVPALLAALEAEWVCPVCTVSVTEVQDAMEVPAKKHKVFQAIQHAVHEYDKYAEALRNRIIARAVIRAAKMHDAGKQIPGKRA